MEGNIVKGVGQLSPVYKPAIQVSGANNTVRRNVVVGSKSWGLEVSSFDGGTASYNLIYNNVFYDSGGCYFQSSSRGAKAYSNVVYANNICYKVAGCRVPDLSGQHNQPEYQLTTCCPWMRPADRSPTGLS